MRELPRGWALATLGEIGVWTGGGTPSKARPEYWRGDIPWVSPKDMKVDRIRDSADHISNDAVRSSATTLVPAGSVLIVTRSGILRHTLPVAVADREVALNQDLKACRTVAGLSPDYVAWFLRGRARAILTSCGKAGTTVNNLDTRRLLEFPIVVAPLEEQRRIVAAIEEQFSRLDAGEAAVSSAAVRLRKFAATSIESVLNGAERRPIGAIAKVGSGATPKRSDERYWKDGTIPWVTSGQVNEPRITEARAYVTEAALRETGVKLWPAGTLILAMYGEGQTRGRCSELAIDATTNQACAAIQVTSDDVEPPYLKLCLNAMYAANRRLSAGGVQPNLGLGIVKAIEVPVPGRDVQRRVVAEAEKRLSTVNAIEATIAAAGRRSAALRRSILERAFRGELVPQDPSDEPAAVLLERIRAERAAADPPHRRSSRRTSPSGHTTGTSGR